MEGNKEREAAPVAGSSGDATASIPLGEQMIKEKIPIELIAYNV